MAFSTKRTYLQRRPDVHAGPDECTQICRIARGKKKDAAHPRPSRRRVLFFVLFPRGLLLYPTSYFLFTEIFHVVFVVLLGFRYKLLKQLRYLCLLNDVNALPNFINKNSFPNDPVFASARMFRANILIGPGGHLSSRRTTNDGRVLFTTFREFRFLLTGSVIGFDYVAQLQSR